MTLAGIANRSIRTKGVAQDRQLLLHRPAPPARYPANNLDPSAHTTARMTARSIRLAIVRHHRSRKRAAISLSHTRRARRPPDHGYSRLRRHWTCSTRSRCYVGCSTARLPPSTSCSDPPTFLRLVQPPTRQRAEPLSVSMRKPTVASTAPASASPLTPTSTWRCHFILASRSSKTSTKSPLRVA